MALQIVSETSSGIALPKAHARVRRVVIETPANGPVSILAQVEVFATEEAKEAGKAPASAMDFTFTDVPEKTETKRVLDAEGKPAFGEDDEPLFEVVVIPADPVATEMRAAIEAGKDPVAVVYDTLKERRGDKEFKGSKDVR